MADPYIEKFIKRIEDLINTKWMIINPVKGLQLQQHTNETYLNITYRVDGVLKPFMKLTDDKQDEYNIGIWGINVSTTDGTITQFYFSAVNDNGVVTKIFYLEQEPNSFYPITIEFIPDFLKANSNLYFDKISDLLGATSICFKEWFFGDIYNCTEEFSRLINNANLINDVAKNVYGVENINSDNLINDFKYDTIPNEYSFLTPFKNYIQKIYNQIYGSDTVFFSLQRNNKYGLIPLNYINANRMENWITKTCELLRSLSINLDNTMWLLNDKYKKMGNLYSTIDILTNGEFTFYYSMTLKKIENTNLEIKIDNGNLQHITVGVNTIARDNKYSSDYATPRIIEFKKLSLNKTQLQALKTFLLQQAVQIDKLPNPLENYTEYRLNLDYMSRYVQSIPFTEFVDTIQNNTISGISFLTKFDNGDNFFESKNLSMVPVHDNIECKIIIRTSVDYWSAYAYLQPAFDDEDPCWALSGAGQATGSIYVYNDDISKLPTWFFNVFSLVKIVTYEFDQDRFKTWFSDNSPTQTSSFTLKAENGSRWGDEVRMSVFRGSDYSCVQIQINKEGSLLDILVVWELDPVFFDLMSTGPSSKYAFQTYSYLENDMPTWLKFFYKPKN